MRTLWKKHRAAIILLAVLAAAAITNPGAQKHLRATASWLSYNFVKHGHGHSGNLFAGDKKLMRAALESDMLDENAAKLDFVERKSFLFFSLTKMKVFGETIGVGAFGYVWLFADMTNPRSAMNMIYNSYVEEARRGAAWDMPAGRDAGPVMPDMAYIDALLSGKIVIDSVPGLGAGAVEPGPVRSGEPAVSSSGPDIQKGARSRISIQRTAAVEMAAMRLVYAARLRDRPGLDGRITLGMSINEAGAVLSAQVVRSTMNDPVFERTVVTRAAGWVFERIQSPGDVTEIIYPLVFSQAD